MILHNPAMVKEVLQYINFRAGGVYVDCTLGDGGHSELILKNTEPDGFLISIDRDLEAIKFASDRLSKFKNRFVIAKENYGEIKKVVKSFNFDQVDGILLDAGLSTRQLMEGYRGFSFNRDGPLDMRMDRELDINAEYIVNNYSKEELKNIIKTFGEEKFAGRIAFRIVREREKEAIKGTVRLAEIIRASIPAVAKKKIDPATRTFQALRVAVNNELPSLEKGVTDAVSLLKKGGRVCVISYHSLEDKIVKDIFRHFESGCTCPPRFPMCVCGGKKELKIITKKPLQPTDEEIFSNPKVRSAKMRVAEKI